MNLALWLAVIVITASGDVVQRFTVWKAQEYMRTLCNTGKGSHAAYKTDTALKPLAHGIRTVDEFGLVKPRYNERFPLRDCTDRLNDKDGQLSISKQADNCSCAGQNRQSLLMHVVISPVQG